MASLKVLVIGGTGFIGERVVEALEEASHEMWTLGRRPSAGRHLVADRESPEQLEAALGGHRFEAVVDLAAYHPRDVATAVGLFNGAQRYVFVSSGVVHRDLYGEPAREEDVVVPEGDPPDGPLDYVWGKRWCEAVLARARVDGFPGVSIRPPAVTGARDRTNRVVAYLARVEDGGPLLVPEGLADRRVGVAWSRDVGRLCARLLDADPRSGAYVVAFPDLTMRGFVQQIAAALGASVPRLVEASEESVEESGLSFEDVSPYGPFRERPGGYDLSRVRSELGFEPSPVSVALEEVVAWYRRDRPEPPGYGARERELALAQGLR